MTNIMLIDLSEGAAPTTVITDRPDTDALTVPLSAEFNVATFRSLLFDAAGRTDRFVIAFGGGESGSAITMNWPTIDLRMRRAFGVLTGAAIGLTARNGGSIAIMLPSFALLPRNPPSSQGVWLRAILGMAEALRAELGRGPTRVGIVFYTDACADPGLGARLQYALDHCPMYSLSPDLTTDQIHAYFNPMLAAVDRASAGPPMPDIGPMAVVYDLTAIGTAGKE